jgi:hypothetical protein
MGAIEDAIAEIESLELGEKVTYRAIAHKYGVNRCTLSRRYRGCQAPNDAKIINQQLLNQQLLNPQQEMELVRYIEGLTKRGLPPTRDLIRNFSSEVAHQRVRESWVSRFIKRHKIHLISKWTTSMDRTRHEADSKVKYRLYFNLLHQKMRQYNLESRDIYNIDEKGFLISLTGRLKRIFSKRMEEKREVRASLQDRSREFLTLIACACANRLALPLGLIYAASKGTVRST